MPLRRRPVLFAMKVAGLASIALGDRWGILRVGSWIWWCRRRRTPVHGFIRLPAYAPT